MQPSILDGHMVKLFSQVVLIFVVLLLICNIYIGPVKVITRHFQLLDTVLIVPDLS